MNVLSTITAVNYYNANQAQLSGNNVFAVFHGNVYDTDEKIKNLDLHPKEIENLTIDYPKLQTPHTHTKKP